MHSSSNHHRRQRPALFITGWEALLRVRHKALDPDGQVLACRFVVHDVGDLVRVDLFSTCTSVNSDHRHAHRPRRVANGELDVPVDALAIVALLCEKHDPANTVENVEVEAPMLAKLEKGLDVILALLHLLQFEPPLHCRSLGFCPGAQCLAPRSQHSPEEMVNVISPYEHMHAALGRNEINVNMCARLCVCRKRWGEQVDAGEVRRGEEKEGRVGAVRRFPNFCKSHPRFSSFSASIAALVFCFISIQLRFRLRSE